MSPRTDKDFEKIRTSRKKQILKVALKLFASNGYHGVSIQEIAKHAKISKGLIYNYFDSKEQLLQEIFKNFTEEFMLLINPNNDNEITDIEAIDFIDKFFEYLDKKRDYCKLYIQLSVQSGVFETIAAKSNKEELLKYQLALINFFTKKFGAEAVGQMLLFSSFIKGFAMQYLYSPEMFTSDIKEIIKKYIINNFIKSPIS